MSQHGAETAFRRTLPFTESLVLRELLAYLKKTLNLAEVKVLSVEEAQSKEQEQGYWTGRSCPEQRLEPGKVVDNLMILCNWLRHLRYTVT
jgi:hypothetical protein